ncbi:MAG TPA: hypothetical protein V6D11_24335 [Waterburya sp.]
MSQLNLTAIREFFDDPVVIAPKIATQVLLTPSFLSKLEIEGGSRVSGNKLSGEIVIKTSPPAL